MTSSEVAPRVPEGTPAHGRPPSSPRTATVGAATALLDAYRPGDARFLATPTRTLLARGTAAAVPHDDRPLPERVADTLNARCRPGGPAPVALGAVPFDHGAPAALAVPEDLRTAPPLCEDPLIALPAPPPAAASADWRVHALPEPAGYARGVERAVTRLRGGELSKVVLARILDLAAPGPVDVPAMLQRLARRDPGGYLFALPTGPERTLIGASPELLLSRSGAQVTANPLAGSVPRSEDLSEDVRRAARLLDSAKDLHEHALVVSAVRDALAPHCDELDTVAGPTLVRTATMWHLSTTVTGRLSRPRAGALELACGLHPTPAVCGTPTAAARRVIAETEPFDRGFFTGMVGWQNADGDGEWVVTIRCADAGPGALRLYAGAGIVAGSCPQAETAETGAKFRTFLDAVGIDR